MTVRNGRCWHCHGAVLHTDLSLDWLPCFDRAGSCGLCCPLWPTSALLKPTSCAETRHATVDQPRRGWSRSREDHGLRKKIGECLIQAGLITEEDLQVALAEHKRTGERIGVVLVRLNLATEKQITKALAYQLGFPYASLTDEPPDPAAIVLIPKDVALKRVCVARQAGEEPADRRDVGSAALQPGPGSRVPDRLPDPAGGRAADRHSRGDRERLSRQGAGTGQSRDAAGADVLTLAPRREAGAGAAIHPPSATPDAAVGRRGLRAAVASAAPREPSNPRRSSTLSTSSSTARSPAAPATSTSSRGKRRARPSPARRHAQRSDGPAEVGPRGARRAHEDHGGDGHRREAPARRTAGCG